MGVCRNQHICVIVKYSSAAVSVCVAEEFEGGACFIVMYGNLVVMQLTLST